MSDADSSENAALPWQLRSDDLGLQLVESVAASLSLDDAWAVQEERGFSWWPKDHRQRVWADPVLDDGGFEIYRLHARSDLLTNFKPTPANLERLNVFASLAGVSAYEVDFVNESLALRSSMYVYSETEPWVRPMFAMAAALQAVDAQMLAPLLAEPLEAAIALTAHPASGFREVADEMLGLLDDVILPNSAPSSAWHGLAMEWTLGQLQQLPLVVMVTGGERGITAELPFQSETTLLRIDAEQPHPRYGNGALLLLTLPGTFAEPAGIRRAFELNNRELSSFTKAHLLGSWCYRDGFVSFASFVPNAFDFDGAGLFNLALAQGMRAKWVAEEMYGDDWKANVNEAGRPLATPAIEEVMEPSWWRSFGRRAQ